MREIKFRGLSEGKWYYGLLTFMFSSYAIVDPKDENTVHLVDVKTVGQYTGLKDKNGVEIYEGDIVRWHDVVTWDYSVTFKDGVFCIADDPSSNFYHLKEDINGKFEVIGNIYENPELLEDSAE